jgi:signal transduction histidine kinase
MAIKQDRVDADDQQSRPSYLNSGIRVRPRVDDLVLMGLHDLGSPLSTLRGGVYMLGREADKPDADPRRTMELVQRLNKSIDRMSVMVTDLIALVTAAPRAQQPEEVDLAALVVEVARSFEGECELAVHAPTPVAGSWRPTPLWQVVHNLVTNAVTHGRHAPIVVSVWQDRHHAFVSVEDHGPGIAASEQPHVFERAWRGSNGSGRGHGLGLWIVKQLTESLGGTITLESAPGWGTRFTVKLPLPQHR